MDPRRENFGNDPYEYDDEDELSLSQELQDAQEIEHLDSLFDSTRDIRTSQNIEEEKSDDPACGDVDLCSDSYEFPDSPYQQVHRFLSPYQTESPKEFKEGSFDHTNPYSSFSKCNQIITNPAFIGLPNNGNSCYINAIVQLFMQSSDLQILIRYLFHPYEELTFRDLQMVLLDIQTQYTRDAGIGLYDQCDSSLVLGWLVDQCKEKAKQQSDLAMLMHLQEDFELHKTVVRRCLSCHHTSEQVTQELFITLYASSQDEVVSMTDLYNQQYLHNVERKCEQCGHIHAREVSHTNKSPYHLFIIINALHAKIDIPEYLSVPKKTQPEEYILQGIIMHKGISEHYGHYVCYTCADDKIDDTWTLYDDESVTPGIHIDSILRGEISRHSSIKVLWYIKAKPDYPTEYKEPLKGG